MEVNYYWPPCLGPLDFSIAKRGLYGLWIDTDLFLSSSVVKLLFLNWTSDKASLPQVSMVRH